MSSDRLAGKVALVTGGSSGIGKAISIRFASEGAAVAVLARDEAEVESVATDIEKSGGKCLKVVGDVSNSDAMRQAVDQVRAEYQRLDIVVANAGVNGTWAPLDELTPDDWQKTIDVNLTGTFFTIKAAVPEMRHSGGSIIVMSSINGTRVFSNSGATAYATTKAGQVALAKMLALELAKYKIRVNTICPGAIETPIFDKTEEKELDEAREPVEFPEGKIPLTDGSPGSPEQVASVALFLATDESDHVTGSVTFVDGGESLLQG